MIHYCSKCEEEILDGEFIRIPVETRYKKLPSKIAFALNTAEMVADVEEITHSDCKGRTVGF